MKIQFIGNENYNALEGTQYHIDQITQTFGTAKKREQNPFSANQLLILTIDKDLILNLQDTDLINEYFSYTIMVEKHNHDAKNLNHFHESMKTAYLTDKISSENYIENMDRFVGLLKTFRKFCDDSKNRTQYLIAHSRVLLNKERSIVQKIFKKNYKGPNSAQNKEVDKELKKVKKEIKMVSAKSQEEINKAL